jgi:hypothetical protein
VGFIYSNFNTHEHTNTYTQIKRNLLEPREIEKKMQALWLSLKDNVKCGNKLTDVIIRMPPKFGKGSSYVSEKEDKFNNEEEEEDNVPFMKTPARLAFSMPNNKQARLYGKLFIIIDHFSTVSDKI